MIDLVAIDGPVGVGKSSVASLLARRLGWKHLDTGAMYRSVAWAALAEGIEPGDEEKCAKIAQEMTLEFEPGSDLQKVRFGEKEITEAIRSEEVTTAVSTVADHPSVREELGKRQREMGAGGEAVAEGRDMGTVVFPRARWKFYLDADPRERMRRRGRQNEEQGREVDEKELLEQLEDGWEVTFVDNHYATIRDDVAGDKLWPSTFYGLFNERLVEKTKNGNYTISYYGKQQIRSEGG